METTRRPAPDKARAAVIQPLFRGAEAGARSPQALLDEAVALTAAIDLEVREALVVNVTRGHPATLIGGGAVERLAAAVEEQELSLVVVNHPLSPVQQRNLEQDLKAKVIDRTGLILEIFGSRARTREGQLQVELASLTYQKSRLVRSWTHLERQRGGFGFLGGPGESQLELDRRLIGDRIIKIRKELEDVRRTRSLHRRARERVPYPVVALVGYTNAGKSTLFNRLAGADVFAKDLLFATLDPTMRGITLPSGHRIILSDTVGFISDLPTHLVAAFRATLEEVLSADIILHVRDISHSDTEAQRDDVLQVLRELGVEGESDARVVEILNKIDCLDDDARMAQIPRRPRENGPPIAALSAVTGEGLDELCSLLDRIMTATREEASYAFPVSEGAALAWLHAHGEVVSRDDDDELVRVRVLLSPADHNRFRSRFVDTASGGGAP